MFFFAGHEHVFLANTVHSAFCFFENNNTMSHFSAYHDSAYCSWKDLFAIYMHILHICSTIYMEDTGRSKNASNILDF